MQAFLRIFRISLAFIIPLLATKSVLMRAYGFIQYALIMAIVSVIVVLSVKQHMFADVLPLY